MSGLVVIVPSRGRPENAHRLANVFDGADAELMLCVDADDPTLPLYPPCEVGPPARLVPWLNRAVTHVLADSAVRFVGFMGDDHLPRTPGWDAVVCDTLAEMGTGIVYGDDLLQGERLATAAFMTRDIVDTLGYMAPPELVHMYVDNVWMEWGRAIDRLRYLPDVMIEHIHPGNGKAAFDVSYQTSAGFMGPDGEAFQRYMAGRFHEDVAKLRGLL